MEWLMSVLGMKPAAGCSFQVPPESADAVQPAAPPLTPARFKAMVVDGELKFTSGKDSSFVPVMYREFVEGAAPDVVRLTMSNLPAARLQRLLDTLPFYACLRTLNLNDSPELGGQAVDGTALLAQLGEALLADGTTPRLAHLFLQYCGVGDGGARALVPLVQGRAELMVYLRNNDEIGGEAKEELQRVGPGRVFF